MDDSVEVAQLRATVTGRYLVRRPASAAPAPLLVGCHGYGENARSHLAELRSIPGAGDWLCCAVQALHPFYDRRRNEVVASWMTRLDREQAIEDNRGYVAAVLDELETNFGRRGPLVLAGFSQGTSMAYRAAAATSRDVSGLLILAGDLPPELTPEEIRRFGPVLIGRGLTDAWYDEARMELDVERLQAAGVAVSTLPFEGGHEWTDQFRAEAAAFLAGLRE